MVSSCAKDGAANSDRPATGGHAGDQKTHARFSRAACGEGDGRGLAISLKCYGFVPFMSNS